MGCRAGRESDHSSATTRASFHSLQAPPWRGRGRAGRTAPSRPTTRSTSAASAREARALKPQVTGALTGARFACVVHCSAMRPLIPVLALVGLACVRAPVSPALPASPASARSIAPEPAERHLRNVRQLTNGGENAEAYFSADGKQLVF